MVTLVNTNLVADHDQARVIRVPDIVIEPGTVAVVSVRDDRARLALMRHVAGLPKANSLGWTIQSSIVRASHFEDFRTGFVYENPEAQFSQLFDSAASELILPLAIRGVSADAQALALDYALAVWGLQRARFARLADLSDGQRQRLLTASMLLADNSLLLIDGAFGHIHPADRCRLLAFLKVHCMGTGRALALFVPTLDEVCAELADQIAIENDVEVTSPRWAKRSHILDSQRPKVGPPVVVVKNLVWRVPNSNLQLFNGLAFSMRRGQSAIVTGPNGSGKSTLGTLLLGAMAPTTGDILIQSQYIDARSVPAKVALAPADPDYVLGEESMGAEIVLNPRSALGSQDITFLKSLLALDNLEKENPFSLPWHQRRRVAVLQALASAELVVYLDEPTAEASNDDVESLESAISYCSSRGLNIICASNDTRLIGSPIFDVHIVVSAPVACVITELGTHPVVVDTGEERWSNPIEQWERVADSWIANTSEFCLFWTRYVYPSLARVVESEAGLPLRVQLIDLGCGDGLHTAGFRNILKRVGVEVVKTIGVDAVGRFLQFAMLNSKDENTVYVRSDLARQDAQKDVAKHVLVDDLPAIVTVFFALHDLASLGSLKELLFGLKRPGSIFVGALVSPEFVSRAADRGEIRLVPVAPEARAGDWEWLGSFRVSADAENALEVPYFHRSLATYITMLEENWGPVSVHSPTGARGKVGRTSDCRHDEILILTARVL